MTLIVDLTAEELARVEAAATTDSIGPGEVLKRLVATYLPKADETPSEDPTLRLFAQWDREDANMTEDEVAEDNRQWEAFKANVNAERARAGARLVY